MTDPNIPAALRAAGPPIATRGEGNPELRAAIAEFREWAIRYLTRALILTVASPKGGQIKSTLAKELSWLLDAILLDLDWDDGRVSRLLLGSRDARRRSTPLLDALDSGKPPVLVKGERHADLVPGHEDFLLRQPEAAVMGRLIGDWAEYWGRPVVGDTHPGGNDASLGAVGAAHVVLVPVVLGLGELDALEGALKRDYSSNPENVLIVIVKAPKSLVLPAADSRRLVGLVQQHGVDVAETMVRRADWLTNRQQRGVVCAQNHIANHHVDFVTDMLNLAREVSTRAAA